MVRASNPRKRGKRGQSGRRDTGWEIIDEGRRARDDTWLEAIKPAEDAYWNEDHDAAVDLLRQVVADPTATPTMRVRTQRLLVKWLNELGDLDQAIAVLAEALPEAQSLDPVTGQQVSGLLDNWTTMRSDRIVEALSGQTWKRWAEYGMTAEMTECCLAATDAWERGDRRQARSQMRTVAEQARAAFGPADFRSVVLRCLVAAWTRRDDPAAAEAIAMIAANDLESVGRLDDAARVRRAITYWSDPKSALQVVRDLATGDKGAYACALHAVVSGGQADVFRAIHKRTGAPVALKQLGHKNPPDRAVARMRREITVGRWLDGHAHVVPILDHGANHQWFVMPWAEATAEDRKDVLREPSQLRVLVAALTSVLAVAHRGGWIHRDIKPSNILWLEQRWALADWGTVLRPRGQTTKVGHTASAVGTEGFAPPELFDTPHDATFASDIYSIGRVIAWALTGELPRANQPLVPAAGPWRRIVEATTRLDPRYRPQTIEELISMIDHEHDRLPQDPP